MQAILNATLTIIAGSGAICFFLFLLTFVLQVFAKSKFSKQSKILRLRKITGLIFLFSLFVIVIVYLINVIDLVLDKY